MQTLPTIVLAMGMASGALALFTILAWSGRIVLRLVRGLLNLIDDWTGEPERPGFPRRAGIPERLSFLETEVTEIKTQVHPDRGSTLRDAIDRLESNTTTAEGTSDGTP